ncbi:MAG: glycerophosphodiester phosphodiesterase family protein [Pseudolabrys sp.]
MRNLKWLTARPIAHRGLHDASAGVIENTTSAFTAAIDAGYGIECDIQVSADGEAMVHHDDALGRLTEGDGTLSSMAAAAIQAVRFTQSDDRILTLDELCDLVDGRVALLIEIKSGFDGDLRLVARAAAVLARYQGPAALMSFDPTPIAWLATNARGLARGIVAERRYDHPERAAATRWQKFQLAHLLHAPRTRPHFIAYAVSDLPAPAPWLARTLFGRPLLTWTVRSEDDRRRAARYADQMIFEGFRPGFQ